MNKSTDKIDLSLLVHFMKVIDQTQYTIIIFIFHYKPKHDIGCMLHEVA